MTQVYLRTTGSPFLLNTVSLPFVSFFSLPFLFPFSLMFCFFYPLFHISISVCAGTCLFWIINQNASSLFFLLLRNMHQYQLKYFGLQHKKNINKSDRVESKQSVFYWPVKYYFYDSFEPYTITSPSDFKHLKNMLVENNFLLLERLRNFWP